MAATMPMGESAPGGERNVSGRPLAAAPLFLFLLALVLAGCIGAPPPRDPPPPPRDLPELTYAQAAAGYNRHLAGLDRLWARSEVVMRWVEQDGDQRAEAGEGHFIYVPPRRVALTLGKLGKTILWAGSNDASYWLIDNLGDGVAYVGAHAPEATVGDAPAPVAGGHPVTGPLPFKPDDVAYLLGLRPLTIPPPGADRPGYAYVAPGRNAYLVIPPSGNLRLRLEPDTLLPIRVELFDARGRIVAISELGQHQRVETPGSPASAWPRVATDAWVYAEAAADLDRDRSLRLELSGLTADAQRVRPGVFDLEVLLDRYGPEAVRRLDEPITRRVAPLPSPPPGPR